jgi:hypothetical protein
MPYTRTAHVALRIRDLLDGAARPDGTLLSATVTPAIGTNSTVDVELRGDDDARERFAFTVTEAEPAKED